MHFSCYCATCDPIGQGYNTVRPHGSEPNFSWMPFEPTLETSVTWEGTRSFMESLSSIDTVVRSFINTVVLIVWMAFNNMLLAGIWWYRLTCEEDEYLFYLKCSLSVVRAVQATGWPGLTDVNYLICTLSGCSSYAYVLGSFLNIPWTS